ncbi:MAG: MBOAT family protein [Gemmatimonadota bacterium]|nr:MBOAT family protein [Gemmatimonadota bacterium]
MLFNSVVFVAFFAVVYGLYLGLQRKTSLQNALLLAASYVFYGYWDWRFLSLILVSTGTDYAIGLALGRKEESAPEGERRRKLLVTASVVVNLGILGFFKYFNFFADSLVDVLHALGMGADPITLRVVLPIGISFYTFQTLSYTIDIYRRTLTPTRNFLNFAVFVAFFPQLVAGPIERARNLLPQIEAPRRITTSMVDSGLFLILWGYFKKVVIADTAGLIADQVFNNYTDYNGLAVIVGVLAFSVQIYGDFSGYSDIARGLARLMGIELMVNFKLPYFALNPSDFWRRWHISLSSWLRDYLYIPLGGNRRGATRTYLALSITMLLGGLWHGAAWNFVIWGAFHGLILILYRRFERRPMDRDPWGGEFATSVVLAKMGLMFVLTLFGWLIFRSTSVHQIGYMIHHASFAAEPGALHLLTRLAKVSAPLIAMQLVQYVSGDLLIATKLRLPMRILVYTALITGILLFGVRESIEFIYFQF